MTEGSTNKTVDYLDTSTPLSTGGFQYTNETLEFFPTAEGYVRAVPMSIGGGTSTYSFHYIYNYTDHLGNIRLKYTADPQMGNIQIMEENHYYPFGLEHQGYNPEHKIITIGEPGGNAILIPITPDLTDPYRFKYQGQERQDEFGLNWDSFKWRNYDYAIGRFMSIDPLSEKYTYNSPYAFQENKMGLGRELEGLELVYREGTSPEFKEKFGSTVQYMNNSGTSGKMTKLNTLSKTEIVDNTGKGSYYSPSEQAIYWDSTGGVETNENHLLSPATILNHEIDHGLQHKENPEQFKDDLRALDSDYDNKEEKRVIEGSEQTTALKHGEIQNGEVTRTDHGGTYMEMPDPTSTENATPRIEELNEVILD